MSQIKTIISTGPGRLHLIDAAVALKKQNIDVKIITGWVPSKLISERLIDRLGWIVGRPKNLSQGLKKRKPSALKEEEIIGCGFSEFFLQFLYRLSSFRIIRYAKSAEIGWKCFGYQSKKYIKNSDIFHIRSGAGQGGAILKAKSLGMKIVVVHTIAHPKELAIQLDKAYNRDQTIYNKYLGTFPTDSFWDLVIKDCQLADVLLVNSDYVKNSFIEHGYPEFKIKVVQGGINESFNGLKKVYSNEKITKLVFTGGFNSRKGASIVIGALEILRDLDFDFTLDIVGTVGNDINIPKWFTNNPSIRFHGHQSHASMQTILRESDIYIFPTYAEGAAQTVKEAMSVGLPVITTVKSGSPIKHGISGWIIVDDNPKELADSIQIVAKDVILQQKLGRNASTLIKTEHTWENYAKEVSKIYKDLLTNG